MPVADHPVHQHGIRDADHRYGCYNGAPYRETMAVQDGWNADGTRRMKDSPFRMSRDCRYDRAMTDSACAGCCWAQDHKEYTQ